MYSRQTAAGSNFGIFHASGILHVRRIVFSVIKNRPSGLLLKSEAFVNLNFVPNCVEFAAGAEYLRSIRFRIRAKKNRKFPQNSLQNLTFVRNTVARTPVQILMKQLRKALKYKPYDVCRI
jgi:hypothetical protein